MTEWRRRTKLRAVAYKGGKCEGCGYHKNAAALLFHHLSGKVFGISHGGVTRSWSRIQVELDKCKLSCLNCHAETHYPELKL